jgi:hypothetical protein
MNVIDFARDADHAKNEGLPMQGGHNGAGRRYVMFQ